MKELSLHILDVIQNSIEAGASKIEIVIEENLKTDLLRIEVCDNGRGMSEDQIKRILDPFYTTRKTRHIGLGLPLLLEASRRCDGHLKIRSKPGTGTTLQVTFRHSHIDRAPLGDMPSVLITALLSGTPVDWVYIHRIDGEEFRLDSSEIRKELMEVPMTHPKVRHWLQEVLVEGENSLALEALPMRATN
ncbi:MAG: ATP-binding protein [Desulfobacca sp.]|nr:ATP-binding protein [Desulfobacca sp.]